MRIISLKQTPENIKNVRSVFPQVGVQPAVDMRGVAPFVMRRANLITRSGLDTLEKGRKWHKELTSGGAVGLQNSLRLVLEGGAGPILVLEDDCAMTPELFAHVERLVHRQHEFDVAVIGCILMEGATADVDVAPRPWCEPTGAPFSFILTHCVLYTARGRSKVADALAEPQEVQIDALMSMMVREGDLRMLLYPRRDLAWQKMHMTTIQDNCALCFLSPNVNIVRVVAVALLTLATAGLLVHLYRRRGRRVAVR